MNSPEFLAGYPVLPSADVARTAIYYRDVLGFTITALSPDYAYAIVERGNVELHLDSPKYARQQGVGAAECYVWINGDVDDFHAQLAQNGALALEPVADREYQMRDFSCCDPDGNRITFGAAISQAA
jgi:catechol 2,3-dioxygenase-like lactoylglutathione lyase family enzyme